MEVQGFKIQVFRRKPAGWRVRARELPIQPDVAGKTMALESHQRVKLRGPDPLRIELQEAGQ